MIDQKLKDYLDKHRPNPSRTWPDNGLLFHLGMMSDFSWRSVVCATEAEAKEAFGPDLLGIYVSMEFTDYWDKVVWEKPGTVFKKSVSDGWVRTK
jgi:hypothetical protein